VGATSALTSGRRVFDTTDEKLATANGTGSFTTTIHIPASATPGRIGSPRLVDTRDSLRKPCSRCRQTGRNIVMTRLTPGSTGSRMCWGRQRLGTDSRLDRDTGVPSLPRRRCQRVAYVGSNDGKLYAFQPRAMHVLATMDRITGGSIGRSSPAVANGVVYIGSEDGKLYAFSLPAEAPARRFDGSIGTSPTPRDGG